MSIPQKPIQVLHIFAPTFGHIFSGHTKRWVRQFQKWNNKNVDHLILDPGSSNLISARVIDNAFSYYPETRLNIEKRTSQILWATQILWNLIIHQKDYDVIHVHSLLWGGLLAAPFCRLLKRPSICEVVRIGSDDITALSKGSLKRIRSWCLRRFTKIICVSEALQHDYLKHGFNSTQIEVLHNPVNSDLFLPAHSSTEKKAFRSEMGLPDDAKVLLFVGSLIQRKGVDTLLEAFVPLARKYPSLFLVLVGPNSSKSSKGVDDLFIKSIRTYIEENGLIERVIFVGRVDTDIELAKYYQSADIFVFPTRNEGMPNVLLEAMSSALPSVASYLPGITDLIIKDGDNGFLFTTDDTRAMIEKIRLLLENSELSSAIGAAARKNVVDHFNFHAYQSNLEEIYKKALVEKA